MGQRKTQRTTASTPYIPLPVEVWPPQAEVRNGRVEVIEEGAPQKRIALTGQEFLRFRGLWTEQDVDEFASEFGNIRIEDALRQNVSWVLLLTELERGRLDGSVQDWIRLSGLMDYAIALWELVQDDS